MRHASTLQRCAVLLVSAVLVSLAGCAISTSKVYNPNKTVVFRDHIINVSNVKVFSTNTDAVISATESIPLNGIDKNKFNSLLQKYKQLHVRQTLKMDEQAVVYQEANVKSWSDYDKMNKQLQSAASSLTKFLADKKATQLKLK